MLPLPVGALAHGDAVLTLGPGAHPAHGLQEPGKVGLEFEEQLRFCFQGSLMGLHVTWCPLEISVKPHTSHYWVRCEYLFAGETLRWEA